MTEGKRNIIQGLLQEYDIESAEDIQDALKDLLSGTIQGMLELLERTGTEIIELGFLKDEPYHKDRTVFQSMEQVKKLIGKKKKGLEICEDTGKGNENFPAHVYACAFVSAL